MVTWKENREKVRAVRAEIYYRAKSARDLETMHWYMWLDECLENDELQASELPNIKWRATVLYWKHEPVGMLLRLIDDCVKAYGFDLCKV